MNDVQNWRRLSERDLTLLGIEDVAYVKPAEENGSVVYTIHAADGTRIGKTSDFATAYAAVRQHDLEPVSAH